MVGSSAEADLLLDHPTVSRRHAKLVTQGDRVSVEDLGSSNGTYIAGLRLHGAEPVDADTPLQFGSLACVLERVAPEETETAVRLDIAGPGHLEQAVAGAPQETLSVGSVREFVTHALPEVVTSLEGYFKVAAERRASAAGQVAHTAGRALFLSFPCRQLEILRLDGPETALLFEASLEDANPEPPGADSATEWSEIQSGSLVVRARFSPELHTQGVEPMFELVGRLAALALGHSEADLPSSPENATAPPLPQPATLDPDMLGLFDEAARIARGDVSVLIQGETGTGKEVLAKYIHDASPRREHPWIAINCAALPEDLLEAELFGIEKGVATGVDARAGKFEQADGGTLFLDEIGDMSRPTQAKILRVLQEGQVYRLGARTARPAQARIIAATNQDINRRIADGAFRLDLFHRIADCRLTLPPLRRRPADLPSLAAHFLSRAATEAHRRPQGISRAALDALAAYSWPGNIRQLEREMTRAALFVEDGQLLQTRHLQAEIAGSRGPTATPLEPVPNTGTLKARLEQVERRILTDVLESHDGNVRAAAGELGIGRTTLYRRLGELAIDI